MLFEIIWAQYNLQKQLKILIKMVICKDIFESDGSVKGNFEWLEIKLKWYTSNVVSGISEILIDLMSRPPPTTIL